MKIILYLPPTSRTSSRESNFSTGFCAVARAIIKWWLANPDARIKLIPTWALTSTEVGWPLTSTTPDTNTGVITTSFSDPLHYGVLTRQRMAELLGAGIAAASTSLI